MFLLVLRIVDSKDILDTIEFCITAYNAYIKGARNKQLYQQQFIIGLDAKHAWM